jgi:hypothetical protein
MIAELDFKIPACLVSHFTFVSLVFSVFNLTLSYIRSPMPIVIATLRICSGYEGCDTCLRKYVAGEGGMARS